LQGELNARNLLDQLTLAARELKIPESVVSTDLKLYANAFLLQEGKAMASDGKKTAKEALSEMQKTRPHWQPISQGAGNTPMRATSNANNFAEAVERQNRE
jgi:hypothetical protein